MAVTWYSLSKVSLCIERKERIKQVEEKKTAGGRKVKAMNARYEMMR